MFAQLLKKTLFSRIISFVVAFSFILTSVPVSYAGIERSDSLRITPATRGNSLQEEIKGDLAKRTKPEKIDPLVLSNIISLLEGAQTGGTNIEHGILIDGANGGIFNHSEPRERLEIVMQSMLDNTAPEIEEQKKQRFYYEQEDRDRALKRLEGTWINTLKKIAGLSEKEINEKLDEWLRTPFNSFDKNRLPSARRLVNYIMNVQLKKVIAYSDKYPMAQDVLCVGETKSQYEAKKTQEILREDLEQILAGITKEQAQKIGLRIAYEPRWAIGTGLTPTNEEIQFAHRFIKDNVKKILGAELDVDYGGSLNEKNSQAILSLADVDGGLIGGAAKDPKKIAVVIDEAIKQGEIKGKLLNIGMNWKAENVSTGLAPLDDFVKLFLTKDLSKVHIAIGTPNVKLVRDTMAELENEISAVSLYSGIVVKTENIGPFTKETLAAKSQNTEAIYAELEKRFGEKTREGDVYFRLKSDNRYFALVKENTKDGTLMTAATLDLRDSKNKADYYAALLGYVFLITKSSGRQIELIEEKGDRLKQDLSNLSYIIPASISIAFKETDRPIARGWSLIVQPAKLAEAPKAEPEVKKAQQPVLPFATINDIAAEGKMLLVRLDINVSAENGHIKDKDKIERRVTEPVTRTIAPLSRKGARQVVIFHQGRPDDKNFIDNPSEHAYQLRKVLGSLGISGEKIKEVNDLFGPKAIEAIKNLQDGEILVLKPVRAADPQNSGKTLEENPDFVSALEPLFDYFVLDGFSVAHRGKKNNQFSIDGFSNLPAVAGGLMAYEYAGASNLRNLPHPHVLAVGGSKIPEKFAVMESKLTKGEADAVLLGGRLGNLALVAAQIAKLQGDERANAEKDPYQLAVETLGKTTADNLKNDPEHPFNLLPRLVNLFVQYKEKIKVPTDVVFIENGVRGEVELVDGRVPQGFDQLLSGIGPKTAALYEGIGLQSKSSFITGPLSDSRYPEFYPEMKRVYKAICREDSFSTTGGGDTDPLITGLGLTSSYASLAGGALAEYLKGEKLPGIEYLIQNSPDRLRVAKLSQVMQTADNTVFTGTSIYYDNLINAVKKSKEANAGAVVVGANAIFENAGSITALKMLKETRYDVVVWAQDEATLKKLKDMGIGEITKTLTSQETSHVGLEDLTISFSESGLPTVLVTSPLDRKGIDLDKIQSSGVRIVNLQTPKADEAKLNSMPLVIAWAVTSIANDDYITNKFEELTQAYARSDQMSISSGELDALNKNLTSLVCDMPLVQVNAEKAKEVIEAQITYAATVDQI